MSIVSDNLKAIDGGRQLIQDAGMRTSRVYIRHGVWNGGEALLGDLTNTDVEITPRPKVEELGNGIIRVGPITPSYAGGGWTPAQLNPAENVGEDIYCIVVGPSGKQNPYRIIAFDGRKPFRYMFTAEQLERSRPNEGW